MTEQARNVLIVEDETLQRTMLLEALRGAGHVVMGVGSAEEAVDVMEHTAIEVAVVDVFLPARSGIELLRAIRTASPRTEVVIITARPSVQIAVDCIRAGAFDFLLKPIEPALLALTVERAAEHARCRARAAAFDVVRTIQDATATELPERAVESVRDFLQADETSLLVPSEDGGLVIGASTSLPPEVQAQVRVRLGERIAGKVAADREPALLSDSPARDSRFALVEGNGRLVSSIVYPLVFGDSLRGVLTIGRRLGSRPFRARDMELTAEMARAIAQALHIAELARLSSSRLRGSGVAWLVPALEEVLQGLPPSIGSGGVRRMIDDLEMLGEPEDAPPRVMDLTLVVEAAVRLSAIERVAVVERHFQPGSSVLGLPGLLMQVTVAMIEKAHLSRTTGRPQRILLTCSHDGKHSVVEVEAHDAERECSLASSFSSVGSKRRSRTGGGPSLAWCREIASSHGGSIEVQPGSGVGQVMRLTMPFASTGAGQVA